MIILLRAQILPMKWKAFWNLNLRQCGKSAFEPQRAP